MALKTYDLSRAGRNAKIADASMNTRDKSTLAALARAAEKFDAASNTVTNALRSIAEAGALVLPAQKKDKLAMAMRKTEEAYGNLQDAKGLLNDFRRMVAASE